MQSLIHGNFKGPAQKRAYALVGASAAIAAAVGPLLGGFLTTYLSWRVGFGLEVAVILVVLSQIRLVKDVPYTGPRQIDFVGAVLSVVGMGGVVLGILVWQEGGAYVGLLIGIGAVALVALACWLVRRKRRGKPTLLDPDLFKHLNFRIGISQQTLQQITLGCAMIVLPLFLQMTLRVQRHAGRPLPRPPFPVHVRHGHACRTQRRPAAPGSHHHGGIRPQHRRHGRNHPPRPQGREAAPAVPNWLRQRVEAVIWTLKNQLGPERHGGRLPVGLWARIIQRLLALNACIWHNWLIGAPVKRSLIAYDHT